MIMKLSDFFCGQSNLVKIYTLVLKKKEKRKNI